MTSKNKIPHPDEIEDWDEIEEVDMSKKRYVSDETLEKLRLPISEVIENFQKVHGDRYDYSKVEYVNGTTKVVIICKEHGEFLQTPRGHRQGSNCPKCKIKVPLYNNEKIILEFQKVHGDRYDYSKVEYVNNKTKVIIICKEHGEFLQNTPHHSRGRGCHKCGKRKGKRKTITDTMTTQIIELRNSKKTIPAIAAEVGVSNSSVKRILKVNA